VQFTSSVSIKKTCESGTVSDLGVVPSVKVAMVDSSKKDLRALKLILARIKKQREVASNLPWPNRASVGG